MKAMHKLVVGAFAVAGFALVAGTAAQAACSSVSVKGEGLTKEIAQEVTKMNLEFAVARQGRQGGRQGSPQVWRTGPAASDLVHGQAARLHLMQAALMPGG